MYDRGNNNSSNVDFDLNWLKNELEDLTKEERCLIIEEYVRQVRVHNNIGMEEFQTFILALNELGD